MKRRKGTTSIVARFRAGGFHYYAPFLAAILVLLVTCVTQRFCIDQGAERSRILEERLQSLHAEAHRWEAKVRTLEKRGRIEEYAMAELGLVAADPATRVYLPSWQRSESRNVSAGTVLTGLVLSGGRGFRFKGSGGERGE